jgi:dienelactone hydrolase
LAEAGFVGFSPLRRRTVPLDGHLDDVLAGVEYVLQLERVDQQRLGLMGFSRGALLALMAATEWSGFDAVVLMAPATGRGTLDRYLQQADNVTAPVLLLVAANDVVQANHVAIAREVREALVAAGKDVEHLVYPRYGTDGHEMFFEVGAYWEDVIAFLKQHLALQ